LSDRHGRARKPRPGTGILTFLRDEGSAACGMILGEANLDCRAADRMGVYFYMILMGAARFGFPSGKPVPVIRGAVWDSLFAGL